MPPGRPRSPKNFDLPPGILKRTRGGTTRYYYQHKNGRQEPLGNDLAVAIDGARKIHEDGYAGAGLNLSLHYLANIRNAVDRLLLSAKQRALSRGIEFSVSQEQIEAMLAKQGHACAMTGIQFDLKGSENRVRAWAPSIDRIDNMRGYVKDNIRLVAVIVNLARNEFSDKDFIRMAQAITKHCK